MARSINESVNTLKTSLTEIGTALTNKNIEGGVENLKVSQVAGLIDQIEVGSGGGSGAIPFTYIDYIEVEGKQYKDNFGGVTYKGMGDSGSFTFKIKVKSDAFFVNKPTNLSVEPSIREYDLEANQEYTFTIQDNKMFNICGIPIVISQCGNYDDTYIQPDFFFIYYDYEGE